MLRRRWELALLPLAALAAACGDSSGGAYVPSTEVVIGDPTPTAHPRIGARIFPRMVAFSDARVASAFPAQRAADGAWTRQCGGGPVDGVLTDVVLESTTRQEGSDDPDLAMRPGDALEAVLVQLTLFAPGCEGTDTLFDNGRCDVVAIEGLYSGPLKGLSEADLAFDPARLKTPFETTSAPMPSGVTEAEVHRWLRENVAAINGAMAELFERPDLRGRVIGGGGAEDPEVSTDTVALDLACEGCADDDAPAALDAVRFAARTPDREAPHDLLVLVDMSGSTTGIVDPARDDLEAAPGSFAPAPDLRNLASDFQNIRLTAVKRLLRTLRPRDRAAVLLFSEKYAGGVAIPCSRAAGDAAADLDACFGGEHTLWTGPDGVDAQGGTAEGRANLWEAVDLAYSYLRDGGGAVGVAGASKDILVISDGPDTCAAGEAATGCEAACSAVSAADVLARVEADQADASGPRVAVHVVQFESLGYRGPDARQQAVACASGGTYQFIPSRSLPTNATSFFSSALDDAVMTARFALQGRWEVGGPLPAYQSTATAAGVEHALSGTLTLRAAAQLAATDQTFPVAPAYSSVVVGPLLRKPCAAAADCGASDDAGSCGVICSPETGLCTNGAGGVDLPDQAACRGESGSCCEGVCQASGACAACAE